MDIIATFTDHVAAFVHGNWTALVFLILAITWGYTFCAPAFRGK
jgi:hypothetical protein